MVDPDPNVSGKGIACLLKAGIKVTGPIERARSEWLNRGFISLRTKGRPWVTLHRAQTRSGAIAKPDGRPLKITSGEQDQWAHRWLRARHDAILIGVQTVITDDPQLTAQFTEGLPSPLRITLDPHLRIPLTARVVSGKLASGTMVITSPGADPAKRTELEGRGVGIMETPLEGGEFDLQALWGILTTPAGDFHGIASILIEGGARTWQSFRKAGMVDEEVVLMGA
jgi:diaminohydroxyphosphoribosylaminopyrimidine deaminase/5-amino-6-(5-phosphoribosylamino)uracil reductase